MTRRVLCVIGTRPEAIKMAPVVLGLHDAPWAEVRTLVTAQHRDMLDQMLDLFGIRPDIDLDLMQEDQTLAQLTSRLATRLDAVLAAEQPDIVLAQGDTTTVLMTALIGFYRKIPFGHVEAGLRTGNRWFPFPEEMNRVLAGYLADLHFAPTTSARDNLRRENVPEETLHVTGNTVIDALLLMTQRDLPMPVPVEPHQRLVLVTAHRRENFGEPFRRICTAIRTIVDENPDVQLVYPVHPNPNISPVAQSMLAGHERIHLCKPLDYGSFVAAMQRTYLFLTDSGGIQEEAPALGKPVLVLRHETERPEAVDAGVVKLVGTDTATIVAEANRLLRRPEAYRDMAKGVSPYGDGKAAARIIQILRDYLGG
jgi:UDP-N-acetylglucosamine 2-epimerase (non-hydrolysing)